MKQLFVFSFATLSTLLVQAAQAKHAASAHDFCAPQVVNAAKALANSNGSISENAMEPSSIDGLSFFVTLTEDGAKDIYSVVTTGGHDCLIKSVEVLTTPTLRY